jgi:hypothetical protein
MEDVPLISLAIHDGTRGAAAAIGMIRCQGAPLQLDFKPNYRSDLNPLLKCLLKMYAGCGA